MKRSKHYCALIVSSREKRRQINIDVGSCALFSLHHFFFNKPLIRSYLFESVASLIFFDMPRRKYNQPQSFPIRYLGQILKNIQVTKLLFSLCLRKYGSLFDEKSNHVLIAPGFDRGEIMCS